MTNQEIINEIKCLLSELNNGEDAVSYLTRNDVKWLNENIKALEQEPKMGHWITRVKSDLRGDMWPTNPKCSECGGEPYYSNTIYNYKFCPYCGARMVEPQESEDKE